MENTRVEKCDKCHEKFIRRWVASKSDWSQLNDVMYWTDGKGWKNYKLLCRSCLKSWWKDDEKDWRALINSSHKSSFNSYLYTGLLDKDDKLKV